MLQWNQISQNRSVERGYFRYKSFGWILEVITKEERVSSIFATDLVGMMTHTNFSIFLVIPINCLGNIVKSFPFAGS